MNTDTAGEALANPVFARKSARIALTIAGFDPSSGAGVTADLQTFAAHGLFGTSVITALTVQSSLGVFETRSVEADLLRRMLECLWQDMPPEGIKLGMLGSAEIVSEVAAFLRGLGSQRPIVVCDPVLRSSSGRELLPLASLERMHTELLPLVDWITPNWSELALLSGESIGDLRSAEMAAMALGRRHPHLAVVATGGDSEAPVDLLRLPNGSVHTFPGTHVETTSTHGTGCAFSSALLALLLQGAEPVKAVAETKRYVEGALRRAPGLGRGRGPMDLLWPLTSHGESAR